jgi:hypothetical protein
MCPEAQNGNYPAAPEPHPPEGAETSSDPAALPAVEEAIDSGVNDGARGSVSSPTEVAGSGSAVGSVQAAALRATPAHQSAGHHVAPQSKTFHLK